MQFAALLAILPVALLLIYIYKMDSYEKEPVGLLVKLVIFGIISAIPAIILESLGDIVLNSVLGKQIPGVNATYLYVFIYAFFIVAISEEAVKFLAAYLSTWKNPAFNFKFDGIVYCFYASMGFALIENILYVFGSGSGTGGSVVTAIGRALLAIPAHGMFSVFMGYYYGEAKYSAVMGNKKGVKANIARGYIIAVLLHGFYDFCLFTGKLFMLIPFFVFVIIADIYTVIKISKASKTNQAIYNMPQYQPYWVMPQGAPQGGLINPAYSNPMPPAYNQPQGYGPQDYTAPGYNAPGYRGPQDFGPQGYGAPDYNAQGAGPQGYGTPNYNAQSAGAQNFSELHTSILRAEPPKMIYCPNCHNICNFNSFYCGKCSTPIHKFGTA